MKYWNKNQVRDFCEKINRLSILCGEKLHKDVLFIFVEIFESTSFELVMLAIDLHIKNTKSGNVRPTPYDIYFNMNVVINGNIKNYLDRVRDEKRSLK